MQRSTALTVGNTIKFNATQPTLVEINHQRLDILPLSRRGQTHQIDLKVKTS